MYTTDDAHTGCWVSLVRRFYHSPLVLGSLFDLLCSIELPAVRALIREAAMIMDGTYSASLARESRKASARPLALRALLTICVVAWRVYRKCPPAFPHRNNNYRGQSLLPRQVHCASVKVTFAMFFQQAALAVPEHSNGPGARSASLHSTHERAHERDFEDQSYR